MPAQLAAPAFPPDTMRFLKQLAAHNEKAWFEANRARYEAIKVAALDVVAAAGVALGGISGTVVADPRPVGGSLMRIHRDIRFAKDKSPYKTHLGIGFHHRDADMRAGHSAPGYFLHVEPGKSMLCAGMWHPEPDDLASIRAAIDEDPQGWRAAKGRWDLQGESLARVPKGFEADHPDGEDLKRKDFIACAALADKTVVSPGFLREFAATAKAMAPFNAWLAAATGNDW